MTEPTSDCPSCRRPLRRDHIVNRRHPATGDWWSYELLVCPAVRHAWGRWTDDSDPGAGWDVGGRGGNEARRTSGPPPGDGALIEERDWALHRAYRFVPRVQLQRQIVAAVKQIDARPVHKRDRPEEVIRWVIDDLLNAAPDHPRTEETVAMATYWWRFR